MTRRATTSLETHRELLGRFSSSIRSQLSQHVQRMVDGFDRFHQLFGPGNERRGIEFLGRRRRDQFRLQVLGQAIRGGVEFHAKGHQFVRRKQIGRRLFQVRSNGPQHRAEHVALHSIAPAGVRPLLYGFAPCFRTAPGDSWHEQESLEGVIVFLRNRIELVVVAASTSDSQAEKRLGHDVEPIVQTIAFVLSDVDRRVDFFA